MSPVSIHMGRGANNAATPKRPDIKEQFLECLAFHINATFKLEMVIAHIDELASQIDPYIERDFTQWKFGTYKGWQAQVQKLRDYAEGNPAKLKAEMKSYFNLNDEKMAELFPGD